MSRRSFARVAAGFAASALLIASVALASAPQEKGKPGADEPLPPPADQVRAHEPDPSAVVDRMIRQFDLKPHPLPPIPDDPPPHEGAMIDIPLVVEPPDLILVEVLEALPGRPISGERLVRPDGKISLGFYGEVHVRGLTLPQIKVAILEHLRNYIDDETLGLVTAEEDESPEAQPKARPVPPPNLPDAKDRPLGDPDRGQAQPSSKPRAGLDQRTSRKIVARRASIRRVGARAGSQPPEEMKPGEKLPQPGPIVVPGQGNVKITIEVQGQPAGVLVPEPPGAVPSPVEEAGAQGTWRAVHPLNCDRFFVDLTAYNSRNYYVLGDVQLPGKLPVTGTETVLDALQYAGGLLATAEPRAIRLVRPGRDGRPPRVYKVDLEAIQEKGDVRTNYQIFPGDRLVVGRNEVVKKTVELDRLTAPLQSVQSSILQNAMMLKTLGALKPEQADEILKALVAFWARELSRQGDLKLDEDKLREALLQRLKTAPAPPRSGATPGAK